MSRKDMMRNKRKITPVNLLKLLQSINNYEKTIICVFEGEDAKYYGHRIDRYFTLERENLSCKGKSNVLALRDLVKKNQELSSAKILYFIDADFDNNEKHEDVYCTPCYSIENLYVNEAAFKTILRDEFNISSLNDLPLLTQLCDIYKRLETSADQALLDLNAWIFLRKEQKKDDESINLNLNNVELDRFITINSDGSIARKYTMEELDEVFSINHPLDVDKLDTIKSSLSSKDLRIVSRGKYRMEFFRKFLSNLSDDARKSAGLFHGKKITPRLALSKAQLLSELTQYATTPQCLSDFLNRNKV